MSTHAESGAPEARGAARFSHLTASGRNRPAAWNSRSALISVIAHALGLVGVVYASVHAPEAVARTQEVVAYLDFAPKPPEPAPEPEKPEAPEPARPEPEAPRAPTPAPPVPRGTQTLTVPEAPPPEIPAVDISAPAVSVADFSGIGIVGGRADGVVGAPLPPTLPDEGAGEGEGAFVYMVEMLDREPELLDAASVPRTLRRLYPALLRDAGVGGTAFMQFVVGPDGLVDAATVKVIEAPHALLAAASVEAVERLRFRPGRYRGESVRVLIQMPIVWEPED